ncbi:DUF2079 domain-containing protein [Leptolyngbyaceae cyanobacterium UHCC 1019]
MAHLTSLKKSFSNWNHSAPNYQTEIRWLLILTAAFCSFLLIFSLHRYYTFYASYDHGLFNQIFWNNLHGRWFQSSLTGEHTAAAVFQNEIPPINFNHLGQHFVPNFLLWLPIYALFPSPVTLIVLQIGLMAAGGMVLYALARHYLEPTLSLLITAGYFGAHAVIGPTFANFYEHCQIPLFVFSALLAMEKQRWWLFWLMVAFTLGIREDTGIILFGIGLYLVLSRRHPWVGVALCGISFVYVALITSVVSLHFSGNTPPPYMGGRFGQYVPGVESPTTLQVLWGMLTHPLEVLKSLLTPFDRRLLYLLGHWLPLVFVPALSPASWVIAGVPLLTLLMQSGMSALVITLRYSVAIVPGMFYGAILWWASQSQRPISKPMMQRSLWQTLRFTYRTRQLTPTFRRFWVVCISLSIISATLSNPNQAFYFLLPESFHPWLHISLPRQWEHSQVLRDMIQVIPADASVAATTHLIPPLSSRREIARFPNLQLQDEQGQVKTMEYAVADLWRINQYQPLFKSEHQRLSLMIARMDEVLTQKTYGLLQLKDGVVLLQKGVPSQPEPLAAWASLRLELLASLETTTLKRRRASQQ